MTGSTKSKQNIIIVELATLVSSMSNRGTEVGGHARYARRYTGGSVAREGVESIVTNTSAVESQAGYAIFVLWRFGHSFNLQRGLPPDNLVPAWHWIVHLFRVLEKGTKRDCHEMGLPVPLKKHPMGDEACIAHSMVRSLSCSRILAYAGLKA